MPPEVLVSLALTGSGLIQVEEAEPGSCYLVSSRLHRNISYRVSFQLTPGQGEAGERPPAGQILSGSKISELPSHKSKHQRDSVTEARRLAASVAT